MRLRRFLNGICTTSTGLRVIVGAVGVLTTVHRLMQASASPCDDRPASAEPQSIPAPGRTHYFQIRRTQSDLGCAYWVLQGFGKFRCYELYDTWREASDEAHRRFEAKLEVEEFAMAIAV